MRQVRRKTVDPAARDYLFKAKREGLELSWNKYENMLPQDGFSQLGLSCHECLQGPCRLNPFRPEETNTVCGLGKEELVFSWLARHAGKNSNLALTGYKFLTVLKDKILDGQIDYAILQEKAAKWSVPGEEAGILAAGLFMKFTELVIPHQARELSNPEARVEFLLEQGAKQIDLLSFVHDIAEMLYGRARNNTRQVGLGVLKPKAVNICLEGASPWVQALAWELKEELQLEAIGAGAPDGLNVVLAGDFSSFYPFAVVSNEGTVEFAVLTGLIDLYLVGEGLGRGRIPAKGYHTVVSSLPQTKEELIELFRQGIKAFVRRDPAKVLARGQIEEAQVARRLNAEKLQNALKQGLINGICILGGGSNVKVTGDETVVQVARRLSRQNVLCLTYGNSAVTLGKYGYLNPVEESRNQALASTLGVANAPLVYGVGGESDAGQVVDIVRALPGSKIVAVFPELTHTRDFQVALAMAQAGAKVFSGIQLPVAGSLEITEAIGRVITYCAPKELVDTVVSLFESAPQAEEVGEEVAVER